MKISRRGFVKQLGVLSGAAIFITQITPDIVFSKETSSEKLEDPFFQKWADSKTGFHYRYDGLWKVTGQKIYARDFRVRDFPTWNQKTARVLVLRANKAGYKFLKIDLTSLSVKPIKVILHKDLKNNFIKIPSFYEGDEILCPVNEPTKYLSQPLALLYFEDSSEVLKAIKNPSFLSQVAIYGEKVNLEESFYSNRKFVKYSKENQVLFSHSAQGADISAPFPKADLNGSLEEKTMYYSKLVRQELEENKDLKVFKESFYTQGVDHFFMEPESGIAWYDEKEKDLHILLGSQSPDHDADDAAFLGSDKKCKTKINKVHFHSCYLGGGFGGRDRSPFSLLLALSALMGKGYSVVLRNDRFQQFQSGLKRHPAKLNYTLALDKNNRFQNFIADLHFLGGGQNNLSFAVASVGASNSFGPYYVPSCDVSYRAEKTIDIPAGSMRGFGSLQAQFALESMIDQMAYELGLDPIALRYQNLQDSKNHETIRGQKIHKQFKTKEVLKACENSSLWKNRNAFQRQKKEGSLFGVGTALCTKSFGSTYDAAQVIVSIEKDGKIKIKTDYVDMGNGSASVFGLSTLDNLGSYADEVILGSIDEFSHLELYSKNYNSQEELDLLTKDPNFTIVKNMSSAASACAYFQRFVAQEASKLLFNIGIVEAAKSIWGLDKIIDKKNLKWTQGKLIYGNFKELSLEEIAAYLYKENKITAVMAHNCFKFDWGRATFSIAGKNPIQLDGLCVRYGAGDFKKQVRNLCKFSEFTSQRGRENMFSACGVVLGIEVFKKTGQIHLLEAHIVLDCGSVIDSRLVEGQIQGALAMGLGQATCEDAPLGEEGVASGAWNIHRYVVVNSSKLPLENIHIVLLPPEDGLENDSKGIGEVVLNPVLPALANAVFAATGKRFTSLPIRLEKTLEAL